MSFKNRLDFEAWKGRRSKRKAHQGILLEGEVEHILENMREAGAIANFTHHDHFSLSDCDGKDFTVRKMVGDRFVERSFGVTISPRSVEWARVRHDKTPQFCFPMETKPETIRQRIESLFLAEEPTAA